MNSVKIHPFHGASWPFFLIKGHFSKVAGAAETLSANPLPSFISAGREAFSDLSLGMDVLPPAPKVLLEIVILENVVCKARKVPPPPLSAFGTGHFCFFLLFLGLNTFFELTQVIPEVSL